MKGPKPVPERPNILRAARVVFFSGSGSRPTTFSCLQGRARGARPPKACEHAVIQLESGFRVRVGEGCGGYWRWRKNMFYSPGGKKFSIALLSGVKRIYIILNPIKVLLSSFVTRFDVFWTDVPWCWWLLMNFDDCSIVFDEFWWFFNDFWRFLDVFSESARWHQCGSDTQK